MSVAFRLGVMMFLEYVVWGAWLPLLGNYLSQTLHFSGSQAGWIFGITGSPSSSRRAGNRSSAPRAP